MNRITVFMCALAAIMTVVGLAIIWYGVATGSPVLAILGLVWVAFTSLPIPYAWRARYDH